MPPQAESEIAMTTTTTTLTPVALEEAWCVDAEILNHCRGKERCPTCLNSGKEGYFHCRHDLDSSSRPSRSRLLCFGRHLGKAMTARRKRCSACKRRLILDFFPVTTARGRKVIRSWCIRCTREYGRKRKRLVRGK
jgi:hypothetical protein